MKRIISVILALCLGYLTLGAALAENFQVFVQFVVTHKESAQTQRGAHHSMKCPIGRFLEFFQVWHLEGLSGRQGQKWFGRFGLNPFGFKFVDALPHPGARLFDLGHGQVGGMFNLKVALTCCQPSMLLM